MLFLKYIFKFNHNIMYYKKLTQFKKTQEKSLKDVSVTLSETSSITDFALLQRLVQTRDMHAVKIAYCELLNLGNGTISYVPEDEKVYESVIENELSILLYKN